MGENLAEPMMGNILPGGRRCTSSSNGIECIRARARYSPTPTDPIDRAIGFVRTANDCAGDRSQLCTIELIGPGDVLRAGIKEDLRLDVLHIE